MTLPQRQLDRLMRLGRPVRAERQLDRGQAVFAGDRGRLAPADPPGEARRCRAAGWNIYMNRGGLDVS